ncbi:alpha/beta fold hydrolase [Streptomyces sp. NEAU-YJ-81]|uniref:alpha/beta fold hydrolase n=1 Tax=Streptomyces sp. NEAU-YJ-81 TaxID=2820288 RepID=UPI001ABC6E21|nr:alpha/beta hydrolase [Streptomyces sp. NEAU-YJ-81]MBO3678029.1 alpha/beta fold hydrolase [Streptomyces sp. NEAU-YJ-81]
MDLSVPVTDDVKLHFRHRPGTASLPFLLVHGMASSARLWDEVADHLAAAGHAVYAVDLRGHGDSDTPESGYDTPTAVADLVAAAAALGLDRVVVAGHSWGGNVSVRLTAEHPELVAALALVDGGWLEPAKAFPSWDAFVGALRPASLEGATVQSVSDYFRAIHPDWSPAAIEAAVDTMLVNPDGSLSRRMSTEQHMSILHSIWNEPPRPWYAAITVPTLLMPAIPKGADGKWADRIRTRIRETTADLRHATMREYLDSEHDLHAQRPRRVADDLLDLARGVQPTRGAH